jgi:hypothetical protein
MNPLTRQYTYRDQTVDKVFSIQGNKLSAFIIDEESLKFSSANSDTFDSFKEAFSKKISLSTKIEIRYNAIKSIRKEDNDKDILIIYKTVLNIPTNCEFSFQATEDYETFFDFFEKTLHFELNHETLTPFKAIRNYLIGLVATIGMTIISYYQAIEIKNGTAGESTSGKERLFNYLIGLLGDKGVIGLGTLIACYILYKIWNRFTNPAQQIRLVPPNM